MIKRHKRPEPKSDDAQKRQQVRIQCFSVSHTTEVANAPISEVGAYSTLSSINAFFRSSVTSAAASFSCACSASAEASPFTPWLTIAGFLAESRVRRLFDEEGVEFSDSLASASRRSISFWAFSMFCDSQL